MKKHKCANGEILFFFSLKRLKFIFFTFIILEIFPINADSHNNEKIQKIIKFKLNGDIIIYDVNKNNNIIENIKLNNAIIDTKINENNINFKDNNILPTQNGELNYIDSYQHITLLDISLEEFIINSPMIIKKYPNLLFISNRTESLFSININNGTLNYMKNYHIFKNNNDFRHIKNICPKNIDDILFLRFDYYLQMKYSYPNNNNNNNKYEYDSDDLVWQSHYVKIIPIYPEVSNNIFNDYKSIENEDYYIFEINDNKNIYLLYSQDKDIYCQIKDIQNDFYFNNNYYFGNNKRKYLFEYNIIKKDEKKSQFSFVFFKKLISLIIIVALVFFSISILKALIKKNYNNNYNNNNNLNNIKNTSQLQNNDNNDNSEKNKHIINVKQENKIEKLKYSKSKSNSNLFSNWSINDNKNKIFKSEEDYKKYFFMNNIKINNCKGKNNSGRKRDLSKGSSTRLSIQRRRLSHRKTSIKHLSKNLSKYLPNEKNELQNLFKTYISDINKNTNESNIHLNVNNITENEEKYKQIYSLIKSDDSTSSEELSIDDKNQGFFAGELENNFVFFFDNGRLLNCYKDFQFIGKGGFGVVFKATNRIDESQWAIKIMKINLDLKEENEDLKVTQEIKTMLKFKNKNIVRYKTCWFEFNQKRKKEIKRRRAMSLGQRNHQTIEFKNDSLENGDKNIKNRLKKHLKTPLERIQSISKELKLAEKQKEIPKHKPRKQSIIWDDDEESDMDSLGANKNYVIKEEGEDKYICLDDKDNNEIDVDVDIDDKSSNINNENDDEDSSFDKNESNESDIDDNDESSENNNYFENTNKDVDLDVDESQEKDNDNNNDIIFCDSTKRDESDSKTKNKNKISTNIDKSSNSNKDQINNANNNNKKNKKEDSNEYEYENLGVKNSNESFSKNKENENTDSNEILDVDRDSENNSIFREEIKKEKEELNNKEKSEKNNSNEPPIGDDEEEEDNLKNNSEDGLCAPKQKNNKKKKKYPIYFFIQMEYCSGCPMNYYLSHRSAVPSKKLTTYMFYQMCKAVKHIHEGNIIHRDLKPGNIFIIDDFLIKIGDFGLALNSEKIQEKQGGTYLYQSPEQINNQPYDEKIDIFALGVILVELVSKFDTEFERREILFGLKKSCYPEYLKKDHLKEYNLVVKMTRLDPKERPNIKEILKDNDFIDLINESLNSDK